MTPRVRIVALAFTAAVLLLALLTTPARSTPRSVPVVSGAVGAPEARPARSGAPQNERAIGSGEHKAGAAELPASRHGEASPATESGAPTPTPAPVADHAGTPVVVPADDAASAVPEASMPPGRAGWLAWAAESHGAAYLAIPEGPGHRVRLCGAGGCLEAVSNDAGPDAGMRQAGRVGDLGVRLWEFVCSVPRSRGLCWVTLEVLG